MPSVELVAVGTELLLGQLVDTNSSYVAQQLAEAGIDVYGMHTVGDNLRRIQGTIALALERADGVITTGGLGPTVDDLTKEAVADLFGLEMELHEPSLEFMKQIFATFGREMRENNVKQAMMPRGSRVLANPNGTAPGFVAFRSDGKFVASMPGPPREMKPMLVNELLPFLRERLKVQDTIVTRVIHTIGLGESEIDHRIHDLFLTMENPKIAVLAHEGRADVKVMAKAATAPEAEAMIWPIADEIEKRLAGHVFGHDADTLEGVIHKLLQAGGRTVGVAESCTGGRIAAALTAIPGSSKSFLGGIVAYDNAVKVDELGVSEATLAEQGAVSEAIAREMARGARERLGVDVAISTTGIAGPDGGTAEKPVGLVWFCFDDGREAKAQSFNFPGTRTTIQSRATTYALGLLWKTLTSGSR
jgi:nicotinamide-nucleotide amidase